MGRVISGAPKIDRLLPGSTENGLDLVLQVCDSYQVWVERIFKGRICQFLTGFQ